MFSHSLTHSYQSSATEAAPLVRCSGGTRAIRCSRAGFTLVELMITIAIIGIVTALVMVKYGAYNSTTLLRAQAYEVALNLRDAQSRAINVRGANEDFRAPYGIYVASGSRSYQLFVDTNTNGQYDEGNDEALGDAFTLDERFQFSALCFTNPCEDDTANALSITFARPDFDARIRDDEGDKVSSSARIELSAERGVEGETRAVVVYPAGQIAVD